MCSSYSTCAKNPKTELPRCHHGEVNELLSNTAHGYKTNTLVEENSGMVGEMCKMGQGLPMDSVPQPPRPTQANGVGLNEANGAPVPNENPTAPNPPPVNANATATATATDEKEKQLNKIDLTIFI